MWTVSTFHKGEPTIWLSQHQMGWPQTLTSYCVHKPWEGDNVFVSSATHKTSAPASSSLPFKISRVLIHSITSLDHQPCAGHMAWSPAQTWCCPLGCPATGAGSHDHSRDLAPPGWMAGHRSLPSKSPVTGRIGPAKEHSSSALPPKLVAKGKAHARLKSHQWHPANWLPLAYLAWNRKYIFLLFILLTSGIN